MALGVPFGNYRLVRRIARGGMAEVFLAWQLSSSGAEEGKRAAGAGPDDFFDGTTGVRSVRQVAVKRILPHLSESDEFRALFLQEARLAATLSHPNVVHIYDFGSTGGCLFLAMELLSGVGLGKLSRRAAGAPAGQEGPAGPPAPPIPPIPIEHAVRIAADALAGLHHAHTRTDAAGRPLSIVHRDVSPQNIIITLDGVVKILDFGIAKAAWSTEETRTGVIRGKYAYMSPEQAEGHRPDGRSDLYSLGVCLFELLTGAPLVPRDLPVEAALAAVRRGSAASALGQIEILRPDVPEELQAILQRALQPRREHRYGSAAEMQLDLERFLKGWPGLSSSLLLGEYLRQHHAADTQSAYEEDPGADTPVLGLGAGPQGTGEESALPELDEGSLAEIPLTSASELRRVAAAGRDETALTEVEPEEEGEEEGENAETVVDPHPSGVSTDMLPPVFATLVPLRRDPGWEVIQRLPGPGETVLTPQSRVHTHLVEVQPPHQPHLPERPPGGEPTSVVKLPSWLGPPLVALWVMACLAVLGMVLFWRGCI